MLCECLYERMSLRDGRRGHRWRGYRRQARCATGADFCVVFVKRGRCAAADDNVARSERTVYTRTELPHHTHGRQREPSTASSSHTRRELARNALAHTAQAAKAVGSAAVQFCRRDTRQQAFCRGPCAGSRFFGEREREGARSKA